MSKWTETLDPLIEGMNPKEIDPDVLMLKISQLENFTTNNSGWLDSIDDVIAGPSTMGDCGIMLLLQIAGAGMDSDAQEISFSNTTSDMVTHSESLTARVPTSNSLQSSTYLHPEPVLPFVNPLSIPISYPLNSSFHPNVAPLEAPSVSQPQPPDHALKYVSPLVAMQTNISIPKSSDPNILKLSKEKEAVKANRQAAIKRWLEKRSRSLNKMKKETAKKVNGRSIVAQQKQRVNGRFMASGKIEWIPATEFQEQLGPNGQPIRAGKQIEVAPPRLPSTTKVGWLPATEFNEHIREWEAAQLRMGTQSLPT